MKKTLAAIAIAASIATAAFALDPATLTFTNNRADAAAEVGDSAYFRGTTLLLTNCHAQTTGTTTQNLGAGVGVVVSVGSASTNVDYSATIIDTNAGTWWVSVTVPDFVGVNPFIQVKLTNSATTYIYPLKTMNSQDAL